ncbi:MAG: hypothetical protein ACI841_000744 [Planctomycetota bacterium]|jgi:hypothetical protein
MAEIMVVIVIIAMVSYSVGIAFEAILPGERLNSSVRSLSGVLQSTRSEAIARNAEFWIEYDLEKERYRVHTPYRKGGGRLIATHDEDELDEQFLLPWNTLEDGIDISSVFIAGELYDDSSVMVRFDPLGSASGHSVILRQPMFNNVFTVEVMALTGSVRLHYEEFFRDVPEDGEFN